MVFNFFPFCMYIHVFLKSTWITCAVMYKTSRERERGKRGWRERDQETGGSQARQVFRTQQTIAIK